MKSTLILLALGFASATALPTRIVGGSLTTISEHPYMVAMLNSWDGNTFWQSCGGSIINSRSVLTAAHCTESERTDLWRARVGSTWANSGGVVHFLITIINHPDYNPFTIDSDISIVRTASAITYVNQAVQPGSFAGPNYSTGDNAVVWVAGWGRTAVDGPSSEQLRQVQVYTVNQEECRRSYGSSVITDNMLCSGVVGGGQGQCNQDSGGPLTHNRVVVGVTSFSSGCASPGFPTVNVRVSRFSNWIQANA